MVGIYKISSPSGKVYIGQSWNIESRWSYYKYIGDKSKQYHLFNSFAKYGLDNHMFEVIHQLPKDTDQSILNVYEQLYMDAYRDAGVILLNCKEAGSNGKLHPDAIERRSAKLRGRKRPEEFGKRISITNSLRGVSEETKKKISIANSGKSPSLEVRMKISKGGKGIKKSEEAKKRISAGLSGLPKTEDHRKTISENRIAKGTARGENNPKAKITIDQVKELRLKYSQGVKPKQLKADYNLSDSGFWCIINRINWAHV